MALLKKWPEYCAKQLSDWGGWFQAAQLSWGCQIGGPWQFWQDGYFLHTTSQYGPYNFIKIIPWKKQINYAPCLLCSVSTMRNLDRMLTLVSEGRKDGSVVCSRLCVFECGMDSILTKAFDGVTLQVGCSSMILQVLIMMNAFMTLALAFLGNTLEKMILPASVITNGNLLLKKPIDSRAPGGLKAIYNCTGLDTDYRIEWTWTYQVLADPFCLPPPSACHRSHFVELLKAGGMTVWCRYYDLKIQIRVDLDREEQEQT